MKLRWVKFPTATNPGGPGFGAVDGAGVTEGVLARAGTVVIDGRRVPGTGRKVSKAVFDWLAVAPSPTVEWKPAGDQSGAAAGEVLVSSVRLESGG